MKPTRNPTVGLSLDSATYQMAKDHTSVIPSLSPMSVDMETGIPIAKKPLKPTPPPSGPQSVLGVGYGGGGGAASPPSGSAPGAAFGRRNLMRDKDIEADSKDDMTHSGFNRPGTCGPSSSGKRPSAVVVEPEAAPTVAPAPAPRPSSMIRRGRSYVEAKDSSSASVATAAASTAASGKSAPTSVVGTAIGQPTVVQSQGQGQGLGQGQGQGIRQPDLTIVGDFCTVHKAMPGTAVNNYHLCEDGHANDSDASSSSMVVIGRPVSAKTSVISPIKLIVDRRLGHIEDDIMPDDYNFEDLRIIGRAQTPCNVAPVHSAGPSSSSISRVKPSFVGTVSSSATVTTTIICNRRIKQSGIIFSEFSIRTSKSIRRRKSSRKAPYRPLAHLEFIPEDEEADYDVPSWLTCFQRYEAVRVDMDKLFSDDRDDGSSGGDRRKAKSDELSATLKRGVKVKISTVSSGGSGGSSDAGGEDETDAARRKEVLSYSGGTYNLWITNQMLKSAHTSSLSSSSSSSSSFSSSCSSSAIPETIFEAIRKNDLDLIKEKVDDESWTLACVDSTGNSPLIVAVFCGIGRIVRYMIKQGADMDVQNRYGNTAVHFSHELGFDKVTNYLLKKGASASIENSMNYTYDKRMT